MDHPDLVVGERQMAVAARQGHFRHVATDTVRFGDGTHFSWRGCRGCAGGDGVGGMAGQALRVIGSRIRVHVYMGIVAGQTADAGISAVETLTVGQAIGREADIHLTEPAMRHYRCPGPVALSTKVR